MNFKEADALARHLTPVLRQLIESETAPLKKRIAELEEKQAKSMVYRGAHSRTETYLKSECVTKSGALWVCLADSTTKAPGSEDWCLATKSHS